MTTGLRDTYQQAKWQPDFTRSEGARGAEAQGLKVAWEYARLKRNGKATNPAWTQGEKGATSRSRTC